MAACPPWCAGRRPLACLGDPDGGWRGRTAAAAQALATYFGKHLPLGRPYLLTGLAAPRPTPLYPYSNTGRTTPGRSSSFASLLTGSTPCGPAGRHASKAQSVRRTVQNLRDRTARKMAIQEKELATARDREHLRQMGDLVTANLHAIRKGQTTLTAENFYDPEMKPIQIPLSPLPVPSAERSQVLQGLRQGQERGEGVDPPAGAGGPGAGVPPQRPGGAGPGGDGGRAEEIRQSWPPAVTSGWREAGGR